jgi:DNA-binding NarL/FixJ family response regulator
MLSDAVAVAETATAEIRVLIGDRRRLIAEALAALIAALEGFTVASVVAGDDCLAAITVYKPDLALVGAGRDRDGTIELVRSMSARAPELQIVLVAEAVEPELVKLVLDQHLSGLLLTDASGPDIAVSLEQVAHGQAILPGGWRQALRNERDDVIHSLSERQLEVLTLLADGCSYEEIAARLFITVNTVKFHVRSIFLRLGVRNRMAAARVLTRRAS